MGRIGGRASAEIDAPIDECFAAAADIESAVSWQRHLDVAQVLERDAAGRPARVRMEIDATVTRIRTRLRYAYDPPRRIAWTQEQGDLSALDGSWTFEDLGDDRTRATYAMEGNPGFALGMLVRGPAEASVRASMVEAIPPAFKAFVEARRGPGA